MKLFLSCVILCTGIAEVQSLKCYSCIATGNTCNEKQETCPARLNNCMTILSTVNVGEIMNSSLVKGCNTCPGDFSMNLGFVYTFGKCCSTDLCNNQPIYQENKTPNGLECYAQGYGSKLEIVKCFGIQDRCLKLTAKSAGISIEIKGCASKNICDTPDTSALGMEIESSINCCENNQCNKGTNLPGSRIVFFIPLILVTSSFLWMANWWWHFLRSSRLLTLAAGGFHSLQKLFQTIISNPWSSFEQHLVLSAIVLNSVGDVPAACNWDILILRFVIFHSTL